MTTLYFFPFFLFRPKNFSPSLKSRLLQLVKKKALTSYSNHEKDSLTTLLIDPDNLFSVFNFNSSFHESPRQS